LKKKKRIARAIYLQRLLCFFALFFHTRFAQKKTRQILGITTRLFRRRRKRKERESVFSNGSNVRFETFLFILRVLLSRLLSFSLSLFSNFFFPQTLTVYFFPGKKIRFEFAAPKYYDFVSHNSAEGKKNRTKESERAEMYFESEKPSGE
jgi:hypothetical protein